MCTKILVVRYFFDSIIHDMLELFSPDDPLSAFCLFKSSVTQLTKFGINRPVGRSPSRRACNDITWIISVYVSTASIRSNV